MNEITVIADCSASMRVWGKYDVLQLCVKRLKTIAASFGRQVSFLAWRDTLQRIMKPSELMPKGRLDGGALAQFLNENGNKPILILSDGLWPDFCRELEQAAKKRAIAIVLIGPDQDSEKGKKIASCGCWQVEDIVSAVQALSLSSSE